MALLNKGGRGGMLGPPQRGPGIPAPTQPPLNGGGGGNVTVGSGIKPQYGINPEPMPMPGPGVGGGAGNPTIAPENPYIPTPGGTNMPYLPGGGNVGGLGGTPPPSAGGRPPVDPNLTALLGGGPNGGRPPEALGRQRPGAQMAGRRSLRPGADPMARGPGAQMPGPGGGGGAGNPMARQSALAAQMRAR